MEISDDGPEILWTEAGMEGFTPEERSFRPGQSQWPELPIGEVAIDDVRPLRRQGSHGVFNDNPESGSAHDRVVRILLGFREDSPIPPVEVARSAHGTGSKFKLIHGAHRFYCAEAAGFSHVPAVEVVDIWGDSTGGLTPR